MEQQGYNICKEANRSVRIDVLNHLRKLISLEEFSGFSPSNDFTEEVILSYGFPEAKEACSGPEPVVDHIPSNV